MNSFKQMIKDGTIKRADAMKIPYDQIHVEPGFNLRMVDADYWEGIDALKQHLGRGGPVPALEVRPREEGGVWLVDGHRRHTAYGMLIADGQPLKEIAVVPFIGNDAERVARIMTSNEGAKLKPLEVAEGYRRLVAMGLTVDDIARRVVKTRQHVDQMLILATAPNAVHQMVKDGTVSATTAVEVTRKHGEKAAGVLKEAHAKQGGRKVTAGAVKPWTPPAKVLMPVADAVESLLASLDNTDRARVESGADDTFVSVSARELLDLFKSFNEIEAARKAADEKQRAKQAKDAQGEIDTAEAA
jgi:ParB-like chromosome segregation protein Spo0J